jgi:hypothetical protein
MKEICGREIKQQVSSIGFFLPEKSVRIGVATY